MYNSNSDKDIGTKRIISIGENDFIMTKARGSVGEAPQMENPEEGQADVSSAGLALSRVRSKFILHLRAVQHLRES